MPPDTTPTPSDKAVWYLRTADGPIYGPIALPGLCEWAAQGRIGPAHEVSADGQTWRPASELPDLGMEWTVVFPEGNAYGPLNLFGILEFGREGAIQGEARLIHRPTGSRLTVGEMRQLADLFRFRPTADRDAERELALTVERLERELRESREHAQRLGTDTARFQAEAGQAAAELAESRAERQREETAHAAAFAERVASERALRKRLAEQAAEAAALQEAISAARAEADSLARQVEEQTAKSRASEEAATVARRRLAELESEKETLVAEHARQAAESASRIEELERVRLALEQERDQAQADRVREKAAFDQRIREREEQERVLRTRIERLEDEVREAGEAVAAAQREREEQDNRHRQLAERLQEESAAAGRQIEELTAARDEAIRRGDRVKEELNNEMAGLRQTLVERDALERSLNSRMSELDALVRSDAETMADLQRQLAEQTELHRNAVQTAHEREEFYKDQLAKLFRETVGAKAAAKPPDGKIPGKVSVPSAPPIDWVAAERTGRPAGAADAGSPDPALLARVEALRSEMHALQVMLERARQELDDREAAYSALQVRSEQSQKELSARVEQAVQEAQAREAECRAVREESEQRERDLIRRIEELQQMMDSSAGRTGGGPAEEGSAPAGAAKETPGGTIRRARELLVSLEAQARKDLLKWQQIKEQDGKSSTRAKGWLWRRTEENTQNE